MLPDNRSGKENSIVDLITHIKMAATHHYPPTSIQRRHFRIQLCFIFFLITMVMIWLLLDTKIKCTVITQQPVVVSVFLGNFPNHSNSNTASSSFNDIHFNNLSFKTVQEAKRYRERQNRSAIFRKTMDKARKAWKGYKKRESKISSRHKTFFNATESLSIKHHKRVIAEEISKDLPINFLSSTFDAGGKPIRNIILATWRSGSTFIGSVVNSHPGMFYEYEPLLYLRENQVHPGPQEDESIQIINQIFSCDYLAVSQTSNYMVHMDFKIKRQTRLQRYCKRSTEACNDPNFLTKICRLSPYLAVKTVRLRVQMGEKLLNKTDNLRLLLLIRDPRGIMRSRMKTDWCENDKRDCSSVEKLCGYMEDDLEYAKILRNKYPDRFMAIRYEDVVLKPGPVFQKIFQFFRLQITNKVKKLIEIKTNSYQVGNGESYAKWKKEFATEEGFGNVISIQNNCSKVMDWWGYKMVKELKEMREMDPLLNPPWPEMIIKPDNSSLVVVDNSLKDYISFPQSTEIAKGNASAVG